MQFRKYKNTKVEEDGFKFDSKLERNIYRKMKELKLSSPYNRDMSCLTSLTDGKTYRAIEYRQILN